MFILTFRSTATSSNLSVIPHFCGHGIGDYFHGPPDIYHFGELIHCNREAGGGAVRQDLSETPLYLLEISTIYTANAVEKAAETSLGHHAVRCVFLLLFFIAGGHGS